MAELSADYVRSARRNNERRKQKGITLEVATKLAKILKTTPQWIMHGIGNPSRTWGPMAWRVLADRLLPSAKAWLSAPWPRLLNRHPKWIARRRAVRVSSKKGLANS
jgi:hypothetical protein